MTTPSAAGTGETFVEMTRRLYNGNELVPEPWALIEATQRAVVQRCAEIASAQHDSSQCEPGHGFTCGACLAAAAILAWQKEGK